MKKVIALVLACVICVGIGIGGTLAWLTAKTSEIQNVFTTSDINITLDENEGGTAREFKMVPGYTIPKDPKVTVSGGSEACWLFVKIDEQNGLADYITYEVNSDWTQGDDTNIPANVYYRKVGTNTNDQQFSVIGYTDTEGNFHDNTVLVKETVTKADMVTANSSRPTLTVTAYAYQLYKTNNVEFTPAEAWQNVPTT